MAILIIELCDASSVAVSPSVVVAVGNIALSAVWAMPPSGVRAAGVPRPGRARGRVGREHCVDNVVTTNT